MERTIKFYDTVFNITIAIHQLQEIKMRWFPAAPGKSVAMGSLVQHSMYQHSDTMGPLLCFSCKEVAQGVSRVEKAGGHILQPKK